MIGTARISNLDVIKILAAIAIVFHHYQQCFSVQFEVGFLNRMLPLFGYFVELFFIISVFFAAKSFVATEKYHESFFKYYRKKLLRLYLRKELFNQKYYKLGTIIFSILLLAAGVFMFVVMHKFNRYVWCYVIFSGLYSDLSLSTSN